MAKDRTCTSGGLDNMVRNTIAKANYETTIVFKVTPPNTHIPFAPVLEDAFIPSAEKVIKAIKQLQ